MTDSATTATRTVRFGRRPQRGLLLGFSGGRIACIAGSVTIFTLSLFMSGIPGVALTGAVWAGALAAAFLRWGERAAIDTLPTASHFALRIVTRQAAYRARPASPRPAGTLALPGDAAALRFHVDEQSGAVMVHDPHAGTLTAVALVSHPAYVLLSPEEQSQRVDGWGRALGGLAASGTCARVQVLEVAMPDSGQGITGWWHAQGSKDNDQWSVREYQDLMRTCAPAASTHRTLIAIALDMRKASRAIRDAGSGMRGAAAVLRQDMTGFELGLTAAELHVERWLDDHRLAATLRAAYDPAAEAHLDAATVGRRLATAGPVAVREHWDHLRHDSGYSAVLWVSEWPRIEVPAHFLHAMVFEKDVRKTISITATPLSTAQAMRDIRKTKVEYVTDAAQKQRLGVISDLTEAQEYADVMERERALISGHADLCVTGLIAITAMTKEGLDAAVSRMQRAATQAACETRLLCGQQARAFTAAALPLAREVN